MPTPTPPRKGGAPRKSPGGVVNRSITLPREMVERIRQLVAAGHAASFSDLIVRAVRSAYPETDIAP